MISLNWVNDYVDISQEDYIELAEKITKAGVNIEKINTNHINNLVIGEIIDVTKHPNSDHLNICQVNIGSSSIQIVCGASNVKKGIKVIVALPGAILKDNFEIKKSTIRGVESNGMICALFELGLEEKNEENYNKGITELPENAKVGEDPLKFLNLDDTIYEIDIHKHRNNDCYYHIGFAYEIATILNKKVNLPENTITPIKDNVENHFKLTVNTDNCPYYLAKMVTNITIKESPDFIKRRLISAGMRPINNVVDISNYVMLEYGQPMHFFDKDKLGDEILVRMAQEEEQIITLDGKERLLTKNDIVITNGKKPVCIAGIMGGLNTDIDENTKTIIIESAIFNQINIRTTSARLNLKSEASIRYGKGLNYEYTSLALLRACHLLEKYADAKVLSGTITHDKIDKTPKKVEFTAEQINKLLGITISKEDMLKELQRLDFKYQLKDDKIICTIPNRRLDIEPFYNDIAEEIGRLYGYHNLISTMPKVSTRKGEYLGDVKYRKHLSKRLRTLGLNEVKTYTLVSPEMAKLFDYQDLKHITLPNPMSIDKSIVRTTILPSLLNIYNYNSSRKVEDILIYEIAKTYDINYQEDTKIAILMKGNYQGSTWQNNKLSVDFYLIKGVIENLLNYMGFKNRYEFIPEIIKDIHPGISAKILLDRQPIGIIGKIHPSISKSPIFLAEISLNKLIKPIKPIKYKEVSKYPEIVKDVSFIINKDVPCKIISDQIKKSAGRLLSNIKVFDVYTGKNLKDNEKSIAFSLTFTDPTKTLTDEEVMTIFNKIIKEVTTICNATLRDN